MKLLVRVVLVALFVPAIVVVVIARIWNEIKGIPRLCWWDIRDDAQSFARMWKSGRVEKDPNDNNG